MEEERFWVVDYIVFCIIFVFLMVLRIDAIYLSSFIVLFILVFTHIILRFSCCLCIYQSCIDWTRRRREERHQRREEHSQYVKDVIQRAKTAYLETMTDD